MKEFTVSTNEEGKRLDHFLRSIMPLAGDSFIYKMLRKKNIKLNDKKAQGSERLSSGDIIKVYLKDETFNLFAPNHCVNKTSEYLQAYRSLKGIKVLLEDEDILIVYKPSNVLSQRASKSDISVNEWIIGYMLDMGSITADSLVTFRPSVLNRLDRNTRGLLIGSKTLRGSRVVSEMIKNRSLRKFYYTIVKGCIDQDMMLDGYLAKDEFQNKVTVYDKPPIDIQTDHIKTALHVIQKHEDRTELEVELITGKSHQIRAHLSHIGHPILGDPKYGDRSFNLSYDQKEQELVAYKLIFPKECELSYWSGKEVKLSGYMEK